MPSGFSWPMITFFRKESSLCSKNMTACNGCRLRSSSFSPEGSCATMSAVRVGLISMNSSGQCRSLAVSVTKKVGGPRVLIATNVFHEHAECFIARCKVCCCEGLVISFLYTGQDRDSFWSSNVLRAQNIHTMLSRHLESLLNSLDWKYVRCWVLLWCRPNVPLG